MAPKNRKRLSVLGKFLRWHRYLGLTVAIFVILLVCTGVLLNHTETLELDEQYVQNELVLSWYGIAPPKIISFQVDKDWVSSLDDQLYFNEIRVPGYFGSLVGAVSLEGWVIVALENQLLIITNEGELVEQVGPAEGAPGAIGAIALSSGNHLLVKGGHGVYRTGADLLEWQQLASETTDWPQPGLVPVTLRQQLLEAWSKQTLTWERVLLDLHSGRIFGHVGVWVMDIAALMMLALAATGCYMWWGQRRHKRHY